MKEKYTKNEDFVKLGLDIKTKLLLESFNKYYELKNNVITIYNSNKDLLEKYPELINSINKIDTSIINFSDELMEILHQIKEENASQKNSIKSKIKILKEKLK